MPGRSSVTARRPSPQNSFWPEEADDLWYLYNIIRSGDVVSALTVRKHRRDPDNPLVDRNKGSDTKVFRLELAVTVTKVEFDPDAAELRISGTVVTENQDVCQVGSFHTLRIIPKMKVTVTKNAWRKDDVRNLKLIRRDVSSGRSITGVVLLELGVANIFLLSEVLTRHVQTIRMSIPRRVAEASRTWTGRREAFFVRVAEALVTVFSPNAERPVQNLNCLIIAGPGFAKADFATWLKSEVSKRPAFAPISSLPLKATVLPAATVHRDSLDQVMMEAKQTVLQKAQQTESTALARFKEVLALDEERACYGERQVVAAAKLGAIKTLLITGCVLRSSDLKKRAMFEDLVTQIQHGGNTVVIFSEFNSAGHQLQNLSGIAAILKYAIPESTLLGEHDVA